MELVNIEKLIVKYLDAETSLQEEQTLKNYFTSSNVAPHLQEYTVLFSYFKTSKDEKFTKTITLETKKPRKKNFKWLSVAASVVLLFSLFVGQQEYQKQQQRKQYNSVVEALQLISKNLNKGNEAVASISAFDNNINKINTILKPSK